MQRYRLKLATWTVVREKAELSPHLLQSAEAVGLLGRDLMREYDDDRERFWAAYVDTKHRLRFVSLISIGTMDGAIVHPREIFGPAVREGAHSVAVIHNHPSGDPTPSREDVVFTERLFKCGEVLGIPLLDHVIIGNGTDAWLSLRDWHSTEGGSHSLWHSSSTSKS